MFTVFNLKRALLTGLIVFGYTALTGAEVVRSIEEAEMNNYSKKDFFFTDRLNNCIFKVERIKLSNVMDRFLEQNWQTGSVMGLSFPENSVNYMCTGAILPKSEVAADQISNTKIDTKAIKTAKLKENEFSNPGAQSPYNPGTQAPGAQSPSDNPGAQSPYNPGTFPGGGPDDHAVFYNKTNGGIKIGAGIYDYRAELDVNECAYYEGPYYNESGRTNPLIVVTDGFGKSLNFEICGWGGGGLDCEQKIRDSQRGILYTKQKPIPGWVYLYHITDTKKVFKVKGRVHRDVFKKDQCKPLKKVILRFHDRRVKEIVR